MADEATSRRKAEHLTAAARAEAEVAATARWGEIALLHDPLPEVDRASLDLSVGFLGRRFALPLVIAGMTGGHERAVLRILGDDPTHINDLGHASGLPMSQVGGLLTMMELKGLVRQVGAGQYVRA